MQTLTERMSALKEVHDKDVTSDDKTPTPLWVLLYIYNTCNHECYTDYMEGAKILVNYLSPIEMPVLPLTSTPLPRILINYELTELAQLLVPKAFASLDLKAVRLAELAIIQETLRNLQREIIE